MFRSSCRIFSKAIAAAVLLLALQPARASANGGPLIYPADGNGPLRMDNNSNIRLVREKIIYNINKPGSNRDEADVSVHYELLNRDPNPKEAVVLFVTSSKGALTVKDGAKLLDTAVSPNALPLNWQSHTKMSVVEPISGRSLSLTSYGSSGDPVGTRFSLQFEPGETKNVTIQYKEAGGMYKRGVINPVFSHLYYLSPAEYWEGDPLVEVEVSLPEPGGRLHSNIALKPSGPAVYYAQLDGLPADDWYFSYTYPNRILFPTNMEQGHNLLVLGTSIALTLLAAIVALRLRNSFIFLLAGVVILGFTVYYIVKMGGYPFNGLFVGATDTAVGAMLIAVYIRIRRRING